MKEPTEQHSKKKLTKIQRNRETKKDKLKTELQKQTNKIGKKNK